MAIADLPDHGKYHSAARPTATARKRFATAAVVASAMIASVLAWRWALVEATTDYGPGPESLTTEPVAPPHARRSPPPIDLEVTVLDVHTAPPSPDSAPARTKAATSARSATGVKSPR